MPYYTEEYRGTTGLRQFECTLNYLFLIGADSKSRMFIVV